MRLAQTQVWPVLRNLEASAPSTACSTSASSKTRKAAFPPSSSEIFLIVSALWRIRIRPTSVEPVKVILRTCRLSVSVPPISAAEPVTTLKTPFGTPASWARAAKARAENGVCDAGFKTIVQPAARAGPALRVTIADGKFQGVMAPHTPTGCLRTRMRLSAWCGGITSP